MSNENINTVEGKILSVETDVELENQKGETYTGFKIIYEGGGEVRKKVGHNNSLKFNKPLANDLKTFKAPGEGVLVMEKKDGFNNLKRLVTPDKLVSLNLGTTATTTGKTGGYDVQGVIKGNAITNAVQLAIALGQTTKEGIIKLARLMLEVHKEIDGTPAPKMEPAAEPKKATKVVKAADVDIDDLFS